MAKSKKVAKKEGWMSTFEKFLDANSVRRAQAIGAEINKIKDLCKCYREWLNFLRRVVFFMRR